MARLPLLERLARYRGLGRRLTLLVAFLVACGGASNKPAPVAPAPAPEEDACDVYARRVGPTIIRIDRAAEDFLVRADAATTSVEMSRAAGDLAAVLDGERDVLAGIQADAELSAGHAELRNALDGLAGAVRQLSAVYAAGGDEGGRKSAAVQLSVAAGAWEQAAKRLRMTCPDL